MILNIIVKIATLQTEEPFWLDESYVESINVSDTGYIQRNMHLSEKLTILLSFFSDNARYLDYALVMDVVE